MASSSIAATPNRLLALLSRDGYISAEFPTFQEGQGRMARQFIYHMQGLSKTYPPNRKVLDNIHLSFYPDAKIGVLGVNGSGKSTLLRIMAGIGKEYNGAARGGGGGPGGISPTGAPSRPGESGGG